jgi:hypothetical protein
MLTINFKETPSNGTEDSDENVLCSVYKFYCTSLYTNKDKVFIELVHLNLNCV